MNNSGTIALMIFVSGILGLIVALAEGVMWNNNYVFPIFTTDATQLPGIQIMTIVFFILIGSVFAILAKGR
jgi:hypothetical protein